MKSAWFVLALHALPFSLPSGAWGMVETRFRASQRAQFQLSCSSIGKGMELNGGVCKLIQENFNDKKYPPLFQLNVIWYVGFCLAVEIKCDLQIAPACNVKFDLLRAKQTVSHFSEWALASAT
jgi:hypothetical protein